MLRIPVTLRSDFISSGHLFFLSLLNTSSWHILFPISFQSLENTALVLTLWALLIPSARNILPQIQFSMFQFQKASPILSLEDFQFPPCARYWSEVKVTLVFVYRTVHCFWNNLKLFTIVCFPELTLQLELIAFTTNSPVSRKSIKQSQNVCSINK